MAKTRNKAVFLDRDGTIARDVPYCSCPEDFELFPKVSEAIKLLNNNGFKVVVITNQSGIGRGYFTEDMLAKIHRKMLNELNKSGAVIDAIYYCAHHPDDNCDCRKPKPTMILQAARDINIDLQKSFFIGDKGLDVEAGNNAGCRTILIANAADNNRLTLRYAPDTIVPSIYEAARWIVDRANQQS